MAQASTLLERETELAQLERVLSEAVGGRGGTALIEGPAGIGKSSLAAEARSLAAARGLEVLRASGDDLAADWPFGVVLQLFQRRVLGTPAADRERLFQGPAAGAERLLEGGEPQTDAGDAGWLLYALYWLTEELASDAGLLLAVDDLHLCDSASLRFLTYLAQRTEDLPVAVVCTSRPEPGAAPELLAQFRGGPEVRMLRPRALSAEAAATVVRGSGLPAADDDFCAACWSITGGNPFFLVELVRDWRATGLDPTAALAARVAQTVPDAVLRSLLARLARVPGPATELIRAAAVLGDGAEPRLAAALASLDEQGASAAAAGLTSADLLAREERLTFSHPLVRSCVLDDMEPAERSTLHLGAARLLRDEGAGAARIAAHLLASQGTGARWAADVLRQAATAAMAGGAPESAVAYLSRALAEPPAAADRGPILCELGTAAMAAGLPAALEYLAEAADALDAGLPRAEALERLGHALHIAGHPGESAAAFERARAEVGTLDPAVAERLEVALMTSAILDAERAKAARARLVELMQRPPNSDGAVDRALLATAAVAQTFGGEGSAEQVVALCARVLDGSGAIEEEDPESTTVWAAVGCAAWAGAYDFSREEAERLVEHARRRGSLSGLGYGLYARGAGAGMAGHLDEAVPDLETALRIWRDGFAPYLPGAAAFLANALIERGDTAAAQAALALVRDPARWAGTPMLLVYRATEARLDLLAGSHPQALAASEECQAMAVQLGALNPGLAPWRSTAALAAAALGDGDRASAFVQEEVDLARRFGDPRPLGIALRAAARLERGERGTELLREAVSALAGAQAVLELAHAQHELGARLRREGKRREAREPLRSALANASACGARTLAARAGEELVAAGGRPRRAALTGVDALTPSELRVARLAADGLTNREIAERLFVARRTVETHLKRTYEKLAITGRQSLMDALSREAKDRGALHDANEEGAA